METWREPERDRNRGEKGVEQLHLSVLEHGWHEEEEPEWKWVREGRKEDCAESVGKEEGRKEHSCQEGGVCGAE